VPSKRAAVDWLKHEIAQGRGDEPVHLVDIRREQKKRVKNEPKSTRFVLVCDSPEAYSEMHSERDRIIHRCKNKSVAISLMIQAWREGLADIEIDRLLAEKDGPDL
jgi:hypothetical protein